MTARSTRFGISITWLCCGLSLLGLLSACNDSDGTAAADAQAKQTIGAAGGEVVSRDGSLKLTIPAGALPAATEITVVEVSAANVPANMQPLGAERIYRFEPAGLVFAQPATVAVTLPAGKTLAVLVLDSNGNGEALGAQRLESGTTSRVLSGQVSHFSHLAAVPVEGLTLELVLDQRNVRVGDLVRANATLSNSQDVSFVARSPLLRRNGLAFTEISNSTSPSYEDIFPAGVSKQFVGAFTLRCDAPSSGLLEFEMSVVELYWRGLALIFNQDPAKPIVGAFSVVARQDVVCDPAGTVVGSIRTGIFPMPFGRGPDGIAIVRGAFANLPDTGAPRLGISTALGYVLIDPLTGLVDLNLTQGSPIVQLGSNLLGTAALSASPGGPNAHAALVGYGLSEFSLLGWNPAAGDFGLNQVFPNYPVLDAQHAGGDTAAPVLTLTSPTRGIGFIRQNADGYFAGESGTTITPTQLGGTPRTAVQPFGDADPRVLAVVVPSGGGAARNDVVILDRGASALLQLALLQGTPAYAVRCLQYGALPVMLATLQQLAGCAVTQGDAVHLFTLDKSNPSAVPVVQKIDSPGALGLEWGVRANGLPRAVVANYAANNLTVVDVAADGSVSSRTEPVDSACKNPPHAAPFAHKGKDYVAVTCNTSHNYMVRELFSF